MQIKYGDCRIRNDAVKSRSWRLNSQKACLVSRYSLLRRTASRDLSTKCVHRRDTVTRYLRYVNIHINYISKKCLSE